MDNSGLPEARLAAIAAAIAGDSGTLYHLVSNLLAEGITFDTVLFDLLSRTQQDIGARWQKGDYLVSEEHAATATVETVVALLAGSFDQPSDGVYVVVAAAEGDLHSLPARLAAAHLLHLGYRTAFLGANVLASDLEEYLAVEPPEALVISCAMINHLAGARAAIRAGHAVGVPAVVGGRGFGETGEWAAVLGADAWAPSPRDVPIILSSWQPDPASAESRAADPTPELTEVMRQRASITAATQRMLTIGSEDPRLITEIALLLGAVEAALLVGDDLPLVETLAWQRETLAAHDLDVHDSIAESLRAALARVSPAAENLLARAMGICRDQP